MTFIKATETAKDDKDTWNFLGSVVVDNDAEANVDVVLKAFADANSVKLELDANAGVSGVVDTVTFDDEACKFPANGKTFTCRSKGAYLNLRKFSTTTYAAPTGRALTNGTKGGKEATVAWSIKVRSRVFFASFCPNPSMHVSTYSPTYPPRHRPRAASAAAISPVTSWWYRTRWDSR